MSQYKDQHGNPIDKKELFTQLSEAILANLMVFDTVGIPRKDIKVIVGVDGGTIISVEAMFQTPVTKKLSEEDGKMLFETCAHLFDQYDAGLLPASKIKEIRARHNFDHKIGLVRQSNKNNN